MEDVGNIYALLNLRGRRIRRPPRLLDTPMVLHFRLDVLKLVTGPHVLISCVLALMSQGLSPTSTSHATNHLIPTRPSECLALWHSLNSSAAHHPVRVHGSERSNGCSPYASRSETSLNTQIKCLRYRCISLDVRLRNDEHGGRIGWPLILFAIGEDG